MYAGFNGSEPSGGEPSKTQTLPANKHFTVCLLYAVGPLCDYTSTPASHAVLTDCQSQLSDYKATLVSPAPDCGQGTLTNTFTWTPDKDTPDLVYYQVCLCFEPPILCGSEATIIEQKPF